MNPLSESLTYNMCLNIVLLTHTFLCPLVLRKE